MEKVETSCESEHVREGCKQSGGSASFAGTKKNEDDDGVVKQTDRDDNHHPPPPSSLMNEYEMKRARNIERNNARLRELGLISRREEIESNNKAWKRNNITTHINSSGDDDSSDEENDNDKEYKDESPCRENKLNQRKRKRKKKSKQKEKTPLSPSRKSKRLQGLQPDGGSIVLDHSDDDAQPRSLEDIRRERRQRVEECREARLRAAAQYAELGFEKAAKENPTATYEHCLMRVRTMTSKALMNRIKAIERAAGKHCVIKMAIFKSCLQDQEMWDLAELATEALERLKALQPPPPPSSKESS